MKYTVRYLRPPKRGNTVAETLLLVMFPRRAKEWEAKQMFCFLAAQTKKHLGKLCCGRKMFLKKFRNIFLRLGRKFCVRNKCCVRAQTGNICVRKNVSATMFPRLREPLIPVNFVNVRLRKSISIGNLFQVSFDFEGCVAVKMMVKF